MKTSKENAFDLKANEWDTPFRIERAKIIAKEIQKRIKSSTNTNALEFGCGTALISLNLLDSIGSLTLVDSSPGMLNIVDKKIGYLKTDKPIRIVNDIFSNELHPETFDCIYSSMVMHHLSDISSIALRFHKLLRPGGKLCFVDLNAVSPLFHKNDLDFKGFHGFNSNHFSEQIRKIGFIEEYNETFYKNKKQIDDQTIDYSLFIVALNKV